MNNTTPLEMKADLTEELAIVRALIAKNGQPVLTEEVIKEAGEKPVLVVERRALGHV